MTVFSIKDSINEIALAGIKKTGHQRYPVSLLTLGGGAKTFSAGRVVVEYWPLNHFYTLSSVSRFLFCLLL